MKNKLLTLGLVPIGFLITIFLSIFTFSITLYIVANEYDIYFLLFILLACGVIISLIALKKYSKNKLNLSTFDFIVCTELPSVFVSIIALCWHLNTTQEDNIFVAGIEFLIFFSWVFCSMLILIITIITSVIIHNKNKKGLKKDEQCK